jgi:MAX-like protein X
MAGMFDDTSTFDDGGMMEQVVRGLKVEQQQQLHQQASPTLLPGASGSGFTFSRASSIGSVNAVSCSSASSTHNTEDEDSDGAVATISYKDRRREAHTQAEQKRRDAIKRGYEELQSIVPTCQQPGDVGQTKLSKAAILQKSIEYTNHLIEQKAAQEKKLDELRKEVLALKIMKANYEQIVKAHQSNPQHGQHQLSDETKFKVFQQIMDELFKSFDQSISVENFDKLSGSVFSWLEEYCKPQTLQDLTLGILRHSDPSFSRP